MSFSRASVVLNCRVFAPRKLLLAAVARNLHLDFIVHDLEHHFSVRTLILPFFNRADEGRVNTLKTIWIAKSAAQFVLGLQLRRLLDHALFARRAAAAQ